MSKHPREPIKHTCPDIDKEISRIKSTRINRDSEINSLNEDELKDAVREMNDRLYDCISFLEEIRASNQTLREWGIEEAENVDSLSESAINN